MSHPVIDFQKMHGLGNDFIVIDAISQTIHLNTLPVIQMADRHLGIGCDQLLVIQRGKQADFFCTIFNADGSEAEQCGNGLRAVARFIHESGLHTTNAFTLETVAGVFPVQIRDYDHICITMSTTAIASKQQDIQLPSQSVAVTGAVLSMGNPHYIIRVNSIEDINLVALGAEISTHVMFPHGTNVGFMEVVSPEYIRLRTYERGVGHTLACGSNACAAVASGILNGELQKQVKVEFELGTLTIEWEGGDKPVHMTGPASNVFRGEWPVK